jgi:hypothetical protein
VVPHGPEELSVWVGSGKVLAGIGERVQVDAGPLAPGTQVGGLLAYCLLAEPPQLLVFLLPQSGQVPHGFFQRAGVAALLPVQGGQGMQVVLVALFNVGGSWCSSPTRIHRRARTAPMRNSLSITRLASSTIRVSKSTRRTESAERLAIPVVVAQTRLTDRSSASPVSAASVFAVGAARVFVCFHT